MRPRVLIVSYHAANPLTPRGARSQAAAAHAYIESRAAFGRVVLIP